MVLYRWSSALPVPQNYKTTLTTLKGKLLKGVLKKIMLSFELKSFTRSRLFMLLYATASLAVLAKPDLESDQFKVFQLVPLK